jgi:ActR/RegA family two-component response regulator
LLADNEPNVLVSLANGLGKRGHAAVLAQDALTALSLLDEEPNFSFAVIDLHLDRDSGLSLARTIAEKHPQIRITLCSGFADEELSKELLHPANGAFGFLRKPFNACELLEALHVVSHVNGEE